MTVQFIHRKEVRKMTPSQYRQIVFNLLKIAKVLRDDVLADLINKSEAEWTGIKIPLEKRAVTLLELTAKSIQYNNEEKEV